MEDSIGAVVSTEELTVAEAAAAMGVRPQAIRKAIQRGRLAARLQSGVDRFFSTRRYYLIERASLDQYRAQYARPGRQSPFPEPGMPPREKRLPAAVAALHAYLQAHGPSALRAMVAALETDGHDESTINRALRAGITGGQFMRPRYGVYALADTEEGMPDRIRFPAWLPDDDSLRQLIRDEHDAMLPYGNGVVIEAQSVNHLSHLAKRAYDLGKHRAIAELKTSADVRAELGIATDSGLWEAAQKYGVGQQIGNEVLFTREDVAVLRAHPDTREPPKHA